MDLSESLVELVRVEARRIFRRLPTHAVALEDLVGFGVIGLCEARDQFQPARGVPFDLFARRRIRGSIFDAVRKQGAFGRRGWEDVRRQALAHDLLSGGGGDGTDDAVALNETVKTLATAFLVDAAYCMHSTEAPETEASLADAQLRDRLQGVLRTLPDGDRDLVKAVYDLSESGDSGAEFGRRRGLSRSAVSRAHQRIIEQLRVELFPEAV